MVDGERNDLPVINHQPSTINHCPFPVAAFRGLNRDTMRFRRVAMVLTLALPLTAIAAAKATARAVGSPGAVTVTGGENTLASIAAEVADPKLFRLEGKRAICAGAFTLRGGLKMGPGESLVMENAG